MPCEVPCGSFVVPYANRREQNRKMETITTDKAPQIPGLSQAIVANGTIYLSGQTGTDPTTKQLAGETIEEQTRQSLTNISQVLEAAGATLNQVVKVVVYLADMSEMAGFNNVYREFFGDHNPARAAVAVAGMAKNAKVELDVIAVFES